MSTRAVPATAPLPATFPRQRLAYGLTLLVFLALPLLLSGSPFYLDALILVCLWAALAGAWNLAGGYAGQLSLGHAAFFGIGAYTSTLLFMHFKLSPWVGLFAGGLLAALSALLLGYLTIRLRGPYFSLATIAFGQVAQIVAVNWDGLTRGSQGLILPPVDDPANFLFVEKLPYAYIALGLMVGVLLITTWVENLPLGYYLVAVREDEEAANTLGVNVVRTKLITIALSAFLTAVAGTFYAQYIGFVDPNYVLSVDVSVQIALLAILGGLASPVGPVVGSFILTPLGQFLRAWLGGAQAGLYLVIYGALLVAVVILMPHGVVREVIHRFRRFQRRRSV
jgi:branched-chain amino acid transport system permease protein